MAYDGIVTKIITDELTALSGARIDKVSQPNKNCIVLGFYLNGSNYALNICTDSQNYRVHLTTHQKPNPQIAPNFCMVLRKHLLGLHIKNTVTNNLERIITIEFEGFDDVDDIITKKLVVELMGKHCNILILDEQNIIIDSLRHINHQNDDLRSVLPHIKYIYPTTCKYNFLEVSSSDDFINKLTKELDISNISIIISSTFNGISQSFINESLKYLKIEKITTSTLLQLYTYIKQIINYTNSDNLVFNPIINKDNILKDYFLSTKTKEEQTYIDNKTKFHLNFFLDNFYHNKETLNEFKNYYSNVSKMILDIYNKYNKRLVNINEKLKECNNMQTYRLYGELITANLYKIPNINVNTITLENYYDNNNEITINLNNRYTPLVNAKRFFKKYNKLKNTLVIVSNQKEETIQELNYIESIIYELENCTSIDDISEVFEEISENIIFKEKAKNYKKPKNTKSKKSKHISTKSKTIHFNPIKYNLDEYTLLVGRNNKENDYLTLKYAKKTDIWFHTKDIHGSHAVLVLDNANLKPTNDILQKCAKITAYHSKAKNSSNVRC